VYEIDNSLEYGSKKPLCSTGKGQLTNIKKQQKNMCVIFRHFIGMYV
jgi:hypothetical protein